MLLAQFSFGCQTLLGLLIRPDRIEQFIKRWHLIGFPVEVRRQTTRP